VHRGLELLPPGPQTLGPLPTTLAQVGRQGPPVLPEVRR